MCGGWWWWRGERERGVGGVETGGGDGGKTGTTPNYGSLTPDFRDKEEMKLTI